MASIRRSVGRSGRWELLLIFLLWRFVSHMLYHTALQVLSRQTKTQQVAPPTQIAARQPTCWKKSAIRAKHEKLPFTLVEAGRMETLRIEYIDCCTPTTVLTVLCSATTTVLIVLYATPFLQNFASSELCTNLRHGAFFAHQPRIPLG